MKGISLSSVIQVINLEKQSCDIEARVDDQRGQLHFRDGALVDAMADGLAGEDAAYEILAWEDPEFEVSAEDSPRDRMIEADLTQMLLEIARRQDEELEESLRSAAAQDPVAPVLQPTTPPPLDQRTPGNGSHGASEAPVLKAVPESAPLGAATPAPAPALAAPGRSAPSAAPGPPASAAAPVSPTPAAASPPSASAPASAAAAPAASASAGSAPALNAADLKRVVQIAQDGIGDALLSVDLFSSADGTSYVGVNSQPAVCALVNQVTERMTWAFSKGGLPPLGRYYTAELAGSRMLLVAPCGGLQLSLMVDTSRVQLGLLLNVVLPEVLVALEEVSPR